MGVSKTYISEMYCGHCDKDTEQKITDGGHERDSSNDLQECLECGWTKSGLTDEWSEPEDNWCTTKRKKKKYKNYYMDIRNFVKHRL